MVPASSDTDCWLDGQPVQASLSPRAPSGLCYCPRGYSPIPQESGMSQEATGVPAMPRAGLGQTKAKARLLLGTGRKRSRLGRTRQDLWDDTSWSNQRLNRTTSAPRGTRAKGTAHGRVRTLWTRGGSWGRKGLEGSEMPPQRTETQPVFDGSAQEQEAGSLDPRCRAGGGQDRSEH